MTNEYVRSTLPRDWYRDREYADAIHERIRILHARGYSQREIAEVVGCSNRTVARQLTSTPKPVFTFCGARRFKLTRYGRKRYLPGHRCQTLSLDGERCYQHGGPRRG